MRRTSTMLAVLALSGGLALLSAGAAGAAPGSATSAGSAGSAGSAAANSAPAATAATPKAKTGKPAPAAGARTSATATVITAHQDGACNAYASTGDLCMWYLQNYVGSASDFYVADSNLWDNYFLTPGWGQNQTVANNAESDWNYDSTYTAWVCTGVSYTGTCGFIPPNSGGNFSTTYKNNVESLYWV